MPSRWSLAWAIPLLLGGAPLLADVWDLGLNDDDDDTETDNVPIHGTVQVHDMAPQDGGVPDEDWYTMRARPFASYEAVIEGLTGSLDGPNPLGLDFLASDGATVLATSVQLGGACASCSRTARIENNIAADRDLFIRVDNPGCGTGCVGSDQYTFRFYETTYVLPRYNNTGGQTTVLVLHNFSEMDVGGHIHLFNPAGVRVGGQSFGLLANNHTVINTGIIPGGAGTAGVITISHTGRYGSLAGKAVVLEPSTGFSFDTPLTGKPKP